MTTRTPPRDQMKTPVREVATSPETSLAGFVLPMGAPVREVATPPETSQAGFVTTTRHLPRPSTPPSRFPTQESSKPRLLSLYNL
jgi:hypothetical protein